MQQILASEVLHTIAQLVIGSVWAFHGLYSKLLNGNPRHRQIVGKILGGANAGWATKTIGLLEVSLGVWVYTGYQPLSCAVVQTAALVTMNTLEVLLARHLLISATGMIVLNLVFLLVIWYWAAFTPLARA